ncbi:MAG: hypothetical protein JXQ87_18435 [Bacteroidia bacterium]
MKKLKQLTILLTLTSLAYLQACQEGCAPIDKSKDRISEESKAKMAYTGTETLVFLEIDNGDSTELVFEPSEHYDTLLTTYSYYEAPNGDECIGYETSTEILYREYYCEERRWQFVCGMAATKEQLVLRFQELPRKREDKYNFDIFIRASIISNERSVDSSGGVYFMKKYPSLNGMNNYVTKFTFYESDNLLYYDTENGLISWELNDDGYAIILKQIIRG